MNVNELIKKISNPPFVPIFGDTEVQIKDNAISIIDDDDDMTSVVFKAYLNEEHKIYSIEHGYNIFTPANKEAVIATASLIGERIDDIHEYQTYISSNIKIKRPIQYNIR